MNLNGKTAVITGISRGIGRATALKLSQAGCLVFGWGRTPPAYPAENVHFFQCDITDEHAVQAALDASLKQAGHIDFLINNAGFGYFAPIEAFDAQKFREMFEVNVWGAFYVTKAVVPLMKAKSSGHVINISSIAGRVGMPQGEGYNASKFALSGFSESLFQELRKEGIKVTTVYPGSTQTDFFEEIAGMEAHGNMLSPDDLADTLLHILNSPPNYLIREIEIRPLNSKPQQ